MRNTNRAPSSCCPAAPKQVLVSHCGSELDPRDTTVFKDGLHPTEAGFQSILGCLAKQVGPLITAAPAGAGG